MDLEVNIFLVGDCGVIKWLMLYIGAELFPLPPSSLSLDQSYPLPSQVFFLLSDPGQATALIEWGYK